MRQIQFIFLKRLVTSVFFSGCLVLLLVFAGIVSYQIAKTGQQSGIPAFIRVHHAVVDAKKIVFLLIPLFLSLQLMITDIHNRLTVLLKYDRAGTWWREVFVSTSLLSLVVTIAINGITFLCSFLLIPESMDVRLLPYTVFHMLMEWIALIVIGCVFQMVVLWIKNEYLALSVTTFVFFLQDMSASILRADVASLPGLMALDYKFRHQEFTVLPGDGLVLGAVAGATAILYWIGYILVRDKDFYWSA